MIDYKFLIRHKIGNLNNLLFAKGMEFEDTLLDISVNLFSSVLGPDWPVHTCTTAPASCRVAQGGLDVSVVLPQCPVCWD